MVAFVCECICDVGICREMTLWVCVYAGLCGYICVKVTVYGYVCLYLSINVFVVWICCGLSVW